MDRKQISGCLRKRARGKDYKGVCTKNLLRVMDRFTIFKVSMVLWEYTDIKMYTSVHLKKVLFLYVNTIRLPFRLVPEYSTNLKK